MCGMAVRAYTIVAFVGLGRCELVGIGRKPPGIAPPGATGWRGCRPVTDTPPGAPWEADLARTIEQVATINKLEVAPRLERAQAARSVPAGAGAGLTATGAIPGPNAAQLAAASQMPPGEQRQMAEGMVASLEQKLVADPSNLDGWVMLMRSRTTLGQPDRARKALSDAVAANPSAAARLRAEAEALGIR